MYWRRTKVQAELKQTVHLSRDFIGQWISMALVGEKTKTVLPYADDRVFWEVQSGQMEGHH